MLVAKLAQFFRQTAGLLAFYRAKWRTKLLAMKQQATSCANGFCSTFAPSQPSFTNSARKLLNKLFPYRILKLKLSLCFRSTTDLTKTICKNIIISQQKPRFCDVLLSHRIEERSIVMTVSVCLSVYLFVCLLSVSPGLHIRVRSCQ